MTAPELSAALRACFHARPLLVTALEVDLQDGVALALGGLALPFTREATLDGRSRIDFLVGRTGIEVKTGGSLSDLTRQLHRYAASTLLDGLVVVSPLHRHRALPAELRGKPIAVCDLSGLRL